MLKRFTRYLLAVGFLLAVTTTACAEPARLDTLTGVLYGTLELPPCKTPAPFPVALLIAGSGPTDRNGNSSALSGSNNSLQYLAEALAEQGIASLRYDKRGVAQSAKAGGDEAQLRFETLIDDACSWIRKLRGDRRFSTLTVIGHSEGSLIGMIAARKAWADGFISVAGVGRPAGQLLLDQVRPQLPPDLMTQVESIVASLNRGQKVTDVPPALETLFRAGVQPYLISWFRYDPAQEIKSLKLPLLVVQGNTDIQVGESEAKLLAQANSKARLVVIDGMNHILKIVPADRETQLRSYGDATLPVAPELVANVTRFIQSLK